MTEDKYAAIVAAVVASLEKGDLPAWRRPWRTLRAQGNATLPVNAVSGKAYRGVNVPILWSRMDADMRYLTFNQARQLGGSVRKGERGTGIVFWKPTRYTKKNAATGEDETRGSVIMRFYTVFNVAQCENLKLPGSSESKPEAPAVPVEPAAIVKAMAALAATLGVVLTHSGDRACYMPGIDTVGMPVPEAFTAPDMYAATALHEFTHATGHESRLKRKLDNRFGDKAYAAEELVAEFGSAFLCAALGVDGGLENHASYIEHWHKLLTDNPKALITATSAAQKAADFVLAKLKGEVASTAEADDNAEAGETITAEAA